MFQNMETDMKTELERRITESADLSNEVLAKKIDKFLHIHTEEIQNDGKDTFHHHRYEPTPYRVLYELFEQLEITEHDAILDYGSGLGRLCFYASHRFHCPCTGVEFSLELHRQAEQNLTQFRGAHKARIQFVHTAAENYEIPPAVRYIYCFNPFSTDIFRRVLSNIERSYQEAPRTITLVLYYPEDNTIFYIEHHTSFQLLREVPISGYFEKDRRERFSIYQMENTGHS